MFCPSCGLEDKQSNQFCRACGADLRPVRSALAKPDSITNSAATARDEIGRAVAAKIREMESAYDLKKVAEDVLPNIEKFLESPAEKRLRRVRAGVVTASVGLGATLLLFLISLADKEEAFFLPAAGLIVFFIGLGLIINGLLFTVPPKIVADNSLEAQHQREMDKMGLELAAGFLNPPRASVNLFDSQTNELSPAKDNVPPFSTVTEPTTQHLNEKQPIRRG